MTLSLQGELCPLEKLAFLKSKKNYLFYLRYLMNYFSSSIQAKYVNEVPISAC
jgi:hypothetical protein